MHAALAERTASRPDLPPLEVHVGINTGPVIAGVVGDGSQFGVMGDTINAAARLMNIAIHGETCVSAETARRLRHGFRLEDRGLHEVKGKAKPLAVSALLAELGPDEREAAATDAGAARRAATRSWACCASSPRQAAEGDGVTAVLVGEAGAGSSRLAEELGDRARRRRLAGADGLGPGAGRDDRSAWSPPPSVRCWPRRPASSPAAPPDRWPRRCSPVAPPRPTTSSSCWARSSPPPPARRRSSSSSTTPTRPTPARSRSSATCRARPATSGCSGSSPATRCRRRSRRWPGRQTWSLVRLPPLSDEAIGVVFDSPLPRRPDAGAAGPARPPGRGQRAVRRRDRPRPRRRRRRSSSPPTARGWPSATSTPASSPARSPSSSRPGSTSCRRRRRSRCRTPRVIGQRFSRKLLERVATIPTSVDAALAELVEEELVVPAAEDGARGAVGLPQPPRPGGRLRLGARRRRPAAHRAVAEALLVLEPDRVRRQRRPARPPLRGGGRPAPRPARTSSRPSTGPSSPTT